ncbi:hypothetical protein DUNSADRAFT_18147 [Dunaliella salina]|uniref:Encoded protein n=1 Tax=Dunaliella salina TaxID=3046 RepID=A0ABQ7GZK0_DUNSA|nr:hypothetical protein DUNSADRAFT_18147 [Dunaliella salina]|eukprot:KAF5839987.1 hypothetical protein DUNSADRAFT_18147 [Dunaliella salina]
MLKFPDCRTYLQPCCFGLIFCLILLFFCILLLQGQTIFHCVCSVHFSLRMLRILRLFGCPFVIKSRVGQGGASVCVIYFSLFIRKWMRGGIGRFCKGLTGCGQFRSFFSNFLLSAGMICRFSNLNGGDLQPDCSTDRPVTGPRQPT